MVGRSDDTVVMAIEFTIRLATMDDEEAVSEVLRASYPALMAPAYDEEDMARALPLMTQANPKLLSAQTFRLAETEDGVVVGCGGWTPQRPGTGKITPGLGHVRHFATHADWIGRSVGRLIYAACEDEARSSGIHRLQCYSSLNAQGFYSALGFKPVRRFNLRMGRNLKLPSVLMERSI